MGDKGEWKTANARAGTASKHTLKSGPKRIKRSKEVLVFPVEPRVIQFIKIPRTYVNHSYRDFSSVPPTKEGYTFPEHIWEMSFPEKVHHMLLQEEHKDMISWNPHGRSFTVLVPKKFEETILPKYLGHTRYSSFLRQLANYGFRTLSRRNPDLNAHYNEFMLRGLPHLSKYMPKPKDARRQIPDPDNEPDFYEISSKYPLPDEPDFGKNGDFHEMPPSPEVTKSAELPVQATKPVSSGGLSRLVADPMHATKLGVEDIGRSASSLTIQSTTLPPGSPALGMRQFPVQVAYPSVYGGSMPRTAVDTNQQAAIVAALRAGIAIGSRQSSVFPSSYSSPEYQGYLPPQQQGPYGGRF